MREERASMSDVLASLGVLAAAAAAATAVLAPPGRRRATAMLLAASLLPALILGDQWHTHRIVDLRDHPSHFAALGFAALVATAILACAFHRWRTLLPLSIVFALPFRVPLHAGGESANLLVPLYLVIAGGVVALSIRDWRGGPAGPVAAGDPPPLPVAEASSGVVPPTAPPAGEASTTAGWAVRWLPCLLAAVVVLYGVQILYSADFSKGLQNLCFFFIPFALVFALLREVSWTQKLLALVLWVVALEAVAFVLVGSIEYVTRSLFWNHQVIRSNEFHTYFRVNSVFWDPNIYGRYLALVIVVATAALLWAKERRTFALLTGLVAVLWVGLAPTFSQSSFIALLAGLAVLAALRWSLKWTLATVAAGAVAAVLVVLLVGGAGKINLSRVNIDTSGRAHLVSGGIHLFGQRPIWGYGSGSFPTAYREHAATHRAPVSVSHTEPITIAAEQGIVGLALYTALIVTALWTMAADLRPSLSRQSSSRAGQYPIARAAILAAFAALLVHTMAYAGFFEDPIAWVLLAVGASLAAVPAPVRTET
jgi:putative inorganic carbon (hco3(-)) transporter